MINRALGGVGKFFSLVVTIDNGPMLFHEVRGIRAHGPFVSVGAHFAFDVKVIETHELAGLRVMIWGYLFSEEREGWIAVAASEFAEDLVEGAILLHDVDAV